MLLQSIKRIILAGLLMLTIFSATASCDQNWQMVHGDILQVFSEQEKLLVRIGAEKQIIELAPDCEIIRLGQPSTLIALCPIGPEAYQDALLWLNHYNLASYILVNYYVEEQDGELVSRDIFGKLK